jgi:la-related protein 1
VPSSSSPNGDKHNGGTFGAGIAVEGDRGRQGSSSGASRGAYQGKPSKRATSAGGTAQRRESKGSLPIPSSEKRKDSAVSPEVGEPTAESTQSSKTASAGTQTHDRARQGSRSDDPNFVPQGDGRHFSEGQDRTHHNANGHYHPRERVYNNQGFNSNRPEHHGGDNVSSHGPRERGFEGGRGRGHRGRGNYHNQQYINGHNGAHHQNPGPHFTSTPPHFNAHQTNGQYPAQNSQSSQRPFRGGSRSHPGPNNGNYNNRYPNPNMQPPPQIYMPSYPLPYDFSMISPTGIPPQIEYTGISEIIAQM